jgi:hypothetical protein
LRSENIVAYTFFEKSLRTIAKEEGVLYISRLMYKEPSDKNHPQLMSEHDFPAGSVRTPTSDIRFPTDISLLNEGRECLEDIIDEQHKIGLTNGTKPRTYRRVARKDYLRFVRNRKPTKKLIRSTIRKQLGYMRRDLAAIEECSTESLSSKSIQRLAVVQKLYEQQEQMYETKTHQVSDRIVSIHQPWVRPIVRGKATADVEFGGKASSSSGERLIPLRVSTSDFS